MFWKTVRRWADQKHFQLLPFDNFGRSVAFNADGSVLAVGAPSEVSFFSDATSTGGAVYLFDLDAGDVSTTPTLNQVIDRNIVTSILEDDLFGSAVGLNAAGDLLAVGSPGASFGPDGKPGIGKVSLLGFGGSAPGALTGNLLFADPADTTMISPDDITSIINAGNNLILEFSNDLTIKSDIVASGNNVGILVLRAGRSISVQPGVAINTSGGSLSFQINNPGAIAAQREAGAAQFRIEDASIRSGRRELLRCLRFIQYRCPWRTRTRWICTRHQFSTS